MPQIILYYSPKQYSYIMVSMHSQLLLDYNTGYYNKNHAKIINVSTHVPSQMHLLSHHIPHVLIPLQIYYMPIISLYPLIPENYGSMHNFCDFLFFLKFSNRFSFRLSPLLTHSTHKNHLFYHSNTHQEPYITYL